MASHRRRARDAPRGSPPEWSPEPPGRAGTGRDAFLGEGAVGLAEPRMWKRAFLRRTTPAWMTAAVCPQPTSAIDGRRSGPQLASACCIRLAFATLSHADMGTYSFRRTLNRANVWSKP